jgi:hypothetical protein
MPLVQYWAIGNHNEASLPWTQAEICAAIVADWLPALPFSASRSVLGWPHYLISVQGGLVHRYLVLQSFAGYCERQWKGVLSWMLEIAGTRRLLSEEGYIWIAPASAFYPERRQPVSIPGWHPNYPPSVLKIEADPNKGARLRPDYIAVRQLSNGQEKFAIVESKGTSNSLRSMHLCPTNWADQVRNAVVKVNGSPVVIPRHIVVATRCNPNAIQERSRRLQIRGWNSQSTTLAENQNLLIEVVSAHYSGLCRNLGLWRNLNALKLAVEVRNTRNRETSVHLNKIVQEADTELEKVGDWRPVGEGNAYFSIETDLGRIHVQITKHALSIMCAIRSSAPIKDLVSLIDKDGLELTRWYSEMTAQYKDAVEIGIDRSGFLVKTGEIRPPNV